MWLRATCYDSLEPVVADMNRDREVDMPESPGNDLRVTSLETVIVFSASYESLADFYEKAFDLGPANRSPRHIGFQVGSVILGFDEIDTEMAPGGISLWFTVDDIHDAYDRLLQMGAESRYPPSLKPWGGYLASLYDPQGNIIGLAQRRSEEVRGK